MMRAVATTMLAGAACLAVAGAVVFWLVSFASAQTHDAHDTVATVTHTATLQIAAPRSPADIFLDVYLKSYRPPQSGSVEAIVTIANGGQRIEVGRISIFPAQAFTVTGERDQRAYRFDATAALATLKGAANLDVSVALIAEGGKPASGAELAVDRVAFSPRP